MIDFSNTADSGVRPLPDDLVDKMFAPPGPPPWLEALADLVAARLQLVVRAEVRAALEEQRAAEEARPE